MNDGAAAPDRPVDGSGTSLYVHVPFCVVKCGYCDFNSYVVEDPRSHDRFLDALAREMETVGVPRQPVSVFLGGGTPSLLAPARLARLLDLLREHVDLPHCPEVTMEANPESFTQEKGEIARAAGVTRLSLGVQSFDDRRLRFLDRAHDAAAARRAVQAARAAGFAKVSLDLIFAIPGQTSSEWAADLEQALELGPDHLSCYNLTYEAGTRLTHDLQHGRVEANDEESDRAMFLHTRDRLRAAGFDAYEISNFAGRGGPCRHNDHYWLQGDYVGVGPGACSHRAGVRTTNLKPLEAWAAAALAGLQPAGSAETLSPRQRAGEALWLGIRRRSGVDVQSVAARLRLPVVEWFEGELMRQREAGTLEWDGRVARLTDVGLLLADSVGAAFLASPPRPSDSQRQTVG